MVTEELKEKIRARKVTGKLPVEKLDLTEEEYARLRESDEEDSRRDI